MFIHANWDIKIKKPKYIFVKNTLQIIFPSSSALHWDGGGHDSKSRFLPTTVGLRSTFPPPDFNH